MKKLKDRVAVITGSTSGIGAACAKIFVEHGAKVIIAGRRRDKGLFLENELCALGGIAKYIHCDISRENDVASLMEQTVAIYHKIDILFNNAGIMMPSREIDSIEVSDWKQTFDTNVNGMFFASRFAKPYLLKSQGVILNNASIAGMHQYVTGRSYAYSASKAAVIQFSRQMAKNYGEDGIRVNCICPGIIKTEILQGRDMGSYEKRIPLGRVGTSEDVAKVALFLVSDDAAYVTGAVVPVDGGASI